MRSTCPWPWKLHNSPLARGGAVFGGGKSGSGGTTYQTQTTTIPPEVRARYDAVNARAEQVAQQPFQPYTGQFVAPLTPTQQAGIGQIAAAGQGYQPYQQAATAALTGSAEAALPYYGMAGQNIEMGQAAAAPYTGAATLAGLAGAQAVNPAQLQIGQYMDPYLQSVVAPTMQGLYQQQQQQQSQLMGSQAMRGAFGGDRGAIAAANLARQQGLAAQQAQAGLLSQGYGQALQAAQQQQGVGLQAEQANRAALQQLSPQLLQIGQQAFQQPMAAAQAQQGLGQGLLGYGQGVAQGLAGLGQQGTQTGLAAGQAMLGAGTLEQQTQQQLNAALYNQYLQQQGYPFQVAQFLANIALGTGPLYGSTTTGVTGQPTPFFSDERLKEDIREIGRTHDGQRIIKFRYKGEPEGTSHIGLSAQDVEKHHPEAVSETPEGIKAVDYDMATKPAERAYGGGLLPSSEGGAVHPSMAGLGFAAGGTPGVDAYSQELLASAKQFPRAAVGLPHGRQPGWTAGLSVKPRAPLGSSVQLKAPAPQPTGLSQALGTVKGGLGAVEDAEKLYEAGKGAYDWLKSKKPYEGTEEGLAAYGSKAPAPSSDNPMGPRARGGRIGFDEGGVVDETPAIPGGGDDTILGQLTKKQITPAKLPTHTLGGSGGGSGGGGGAMGDIKAGLGAANSAVNIASSLSKMFAAYGGRIGYDEGGDVATPPDLPVHKLDMSDSAGGGKKDTTAKDALGFAGTLASFIPGVGPVVGAGLKAASMFAKDGGRIGYAEGGGQTFVDRLMPAALKASEKTGVHPHLILAQAALESGWGKHAPGNNYFGIKGPGQVLDTKEQGATGLYNTRDSFRKYESPEHSVEDYANFIMSNSRYRPVREARTLDEQIEAMGRSGYATDRDYTAKLRSIANSLSGNATPFTPRERGHETPTAPSQRSAGLAPPLHDVEDTHEGLEPVDTGADFEMPDRFEMPERFASGGLVPRHGYQTAGAVADELPESAWTAAGPSAERERGETERQVSNPLQTGEVSYPYPARRPARAQPRVAGPSQWDVTAELQSLPPASAPPAVNNAEILSSGLAPSSAAMPSTIYPPEITQGLLPPTDSGGSSAPTPTPPPTPAPAPVSPQGGLVPPLPASQAVQTAPGGNPPDPATRAADVQAAPVVGKEIGAGKLPEPGFFGAGGWFERNQDWVLPLASGIGKMLASPSPYLGVAIGQGLGEAAQMYPQMAFKERGLNVQEANAAANISRYLAQNITPFSDTDEKTGKTVIKYRDNLTQDVLTKEEMDARRNELMRQFFPRFRIPSAASGAVADAAAAQQPPVGSPRVAPDAPPQAGSEADANARVARQSERTDWLAAEIAKEQKRADDMRRAGLVAQAKTHDALAQSWREKLTEIRSGDPKYVPTDATGKPVTWWADEARRKERAAAKSKEGETTAGRLRAEAEAAHAAQQQLATLTAAYRGLNTRGATAPGGAGAATRTALVKNIGSALQVLGAPAPSWAQQTGAAEALAKNTTTLAGALRSSLGSHDGAQVFASMMDATPNISNTPYGFERIVAGMEQALEYKKEKAKFYTDYVNNGGDIDKAASAFAAYMPIEVFTSRGIVNALPERLRVGLAAYMRQNAALSGVDANIDNAHGNGTARALRVLIGRGML